MAASNGRSRTSLRRVALVLLAVVACGGACGSLVFVSLFGSAFSRGMSHLFSPAQLSQYHAEMDGRREELGRLPRVVMEVLADSESTEITSTAPTAVVLSTTLESTPELTATATVTRILRYSKPTTAASIEVATRLANERRKNNPAPTETPKPQQPISATLTVTNTSGVASTPQPQQPCIIDAASADPATQATVRNMSYIVVDKAGVVVRFWNGTALQDEALPAGGTNLHTFHNIADHVQVITIPNGVTVVGFQNVGPDGGSGDGEMWSFKCVK